MSDNPDCRGCGITAADLPDGFALDEAFEDGLCPGCQQIPAHQRLHGVPNPDDYVPPHRQVDWWVGM